MYGNDASKEGRPSKLSCHVRAELNWPVRTDRTSLNRIGDFSLEDVSFSEFIILSVTLQLKCLQINLKKSVCLLLFL